VGHRSRLPLPRPSQQASKFTLATNPIRPSPSYSPCACGAEVAGILAEERLELYSKPHPHPLPPLLLRPCARIGDACWCCVLLDAWIFRPSLGLVKVLAGKVADKLEEYFRTMYKKACFLVSVTRPALPWLGHRTRRYPFRFGRASIEALASELVAVQRHLVMGGFSYAHKPVWVQELIMRIPTLTIHIERGLYLIRSQKMFLP
ncbi:unnamed protein product, partial [Urochloa humidicola]